MGDESRRYDKKKAAVFGERLTAMLDEAALALMLSIGHQTNLFDTLAGLPPATIGEIAAAAQLNERYVREWLNALTVGQIITYDPAAQTYTLPAEHARFLTRAAGAANMAVYMQHIPIMAGVESDVVHCFRHGGGVPYSSFPRFHAVMAEDSDLSVTAVLVERILPIVPNIIPRLEAGIRVLDVGCGRGHALMRMAQAFPKSQFVGYDLSDDVVAFGNEEAARRNLPNLSFVAQDMIKMTEAAQYDFITAFDAIHDQAFPGRVLASINRALKPGGLFLMRDIAASSHVENNMGQINAPFMYAISTMHCMTVSLAQGGEGLGAMWGRELAESLLHKAGFGQVEIKQLENDLMGDCYICYQGE